MALWQATGELREFGVTLTPLQIQDTEPLFLALQDPVLWRHIPMALPTSSIDLEPWVRRALDDRAAGRAVPFLVSTRAGIAGTTRFFDFREEGRCVEIGFTLYAGKIHGSGVNKIAKYLMLRHAFETCQAARVQLKTDARNLRSRHAIASLGASFEGVLRNYQVLADGRMRDTAMFALTSADWAWAGPRLLSRLRTVLEAPEP